MRLPQNADSVLEADPVAQASPASSPSTAQQAGPAHGHTSAAERVTTLSHKPRPSPKLRSSVSSSCSAPVKRYDTCKEP